VSSTTLTGGDSTLTAWEKCSCKACQVHYTPTEQCAPPFHDDAKFFRWGVVGLLLYPYDNIHILNQLHKREHIKFMIWVYNDMVAY